MSIPSNDLCGKIKVPGAPGLQGLSVDELRKKITDVFLADLIPVPSFKGLTRGQLCHLLTISKSGTTFIQSLVTTPVKPQPVKPQPVKPQPAVSTVIPETTPSKIPIKKLTGFQILMKEQMTILQKKGLPLTNLFQKTDTMWKDLSATQKTEYDNKANISITSPIKTPIKYKNIPCQSKHRNAGNPLYICNSLTGKWIKIGGTTYNELVKKGVMVPSTITFSSAAEGQKAEKQKAEKQKVDEQKAVKQKTEKQKAEKQKAEKQKAEKQKAEKHKAEKQKVDEQKAEKQKVDEQKAPKKCSDLGGLINSQSSCYLDSTLLGLFIKDNEFIKDNILYKDLSTIEMIYHKGLPDQKTLKLTELPELYEISKKIQADLVVIYNEIKTGVANVCTQLRNHLTEHQKIYKAVFGPLTQTNWTTAQQEPLDVILRLDTIFNLPEPAIVSLKSYGSNNKKDLTLVTEGERMVPFNIITDVFSIANISGNNIVDKKEIFLLDDFINKVTTSTLSPCNYFISADKKMAFKHRIEHYDVVKSPLLYIHLTRIADKAMLGGQGKVKLTTHVMPSEKLKMSSGSLDLVSIIIHHGASGGGHYTCYLNCLGNWYSYNDIGFTKLVPVGTFIKMMETKGTEILSNATDFIYM
jgi:hypothetical protein